MQTFRPGDKLPPGAAITIGTFDGLHLAHQYILAELKRGAVERRCPAGVVTFDPSPQVVIRHEFPYILTPSEEKVERLAELGLDFVYLLRFDEELRTTPAEVFLERMIIDPLRPSLMVEGFDHRFGTDRKGDAALLTALKEQYHFDLTVLPEFRYHGVAVNSTRIRERLLLGAVRQAGVLLGSPYRIRGKVVPGRGVGRNLGYPTLNLELPDKEKLVPASGVYAVKVRLDVMGQPEVGLVRQVRPVRRADGSCPRPGVMNIGFRPTFSESSPPRHKDTNLVLGLQEGGNQTLEVHVLDFQEQVYNRVVAVEFVERLRPETKFASVEELKRQIAADVGLARLILADAESDTSDPADRSDSEA
jgi:riboflavin kinase/FMN adenylyltransferase